MTAHDPSPDLPLLAAIAEGEDLGDTDFAGRAEATLGLDGPPYLAAVARLVEGGLVEAGEAEEPLRVTTSGRARLRSRATAP